MKFFFIFIIPTLVFASDPYDVNRHKLELLSREIADEIKVYNETLQKEHKILGELNSIEFELHNSSLEIQKREKQKVVLEQEIEVLKKKQSLLEKELKEQNKLLEKRLPVLAQFGNIGFLDVLLSSASYSDLVRRRYAIESIVSHDLKTFGNQLQTRESYTKLTREYSKKLKEHSNIVITLTSKRVYLHELRRQKEVILNDMQKNITIYERYLKDMDQAYDKLEWMLKKLEDAHITREMKSVKNISLFKGKLPKPISGKITKYFGYVFDPRTKTKLPHSGLDIEAKQDASVVSIFPGVVLFSDWFSGYGNLIIIDHGMGYMSLYAHLARRIVKTGSTVELKQKIGEAGNNLYFEMRYQGRAIDPKGWIR